MKTVRDIMTPMMITLRDSQFLPEAAAVFRENQISGAPVQDRDGEYVGFLSQTDINSRLASLHVSGSFHPDPAEDGLPSDVANLQVKDAMTFHLLKISADSSLEELEQTLLIAGVHRLLVVDGESLVGVVSTTDLISGLLHPESQETKGRVRARACGRPYLFETELSSRPGLAVVRTPSGREIQVGPPGREGTGDESVCPEELFVASASSCLCMTFRELADRAGYEILEYNCRAIARLEGDGVSRRFRRLDLYPRIRVSADPREAEKLLAQAHLRCMMGRPASATVMLHPRIEVDSKE